MADKLRLDYINGLPHPLVAVFGRLNEWPVVVLDVQTGAMTIDVCGAAQLEHVGNVLHFVDAAGVTHDVESFYTEGEGREAVRR